MTNSILMLVAVGAVSLLGISGVAWGLWLRRRKNRRAAPAAAVEAPKSAYTYKEFAKDLYVDEVSISDILDRCRGVIPPRPEQESPAPVQPTDGPKGLDPHRQAWFEELARRLPQIKIVPPPPVQVTVQAFLIPCVCRHQDFPTRMVASGSEIQGRSGERAYRCKRCKDTGMVAITKG